MDVLHILLLVLLVVSGGPALEVTVREGDDITLHCDCQTSTGVHIVWYRNCSHENQPPLVLKPKRGVLIEAVDVLTIFPRFQFVRNVSSGSYDLLILNATASDEGAYFCGSVERRVEVKDGRITPQEMYSLGNVTTRIIIRNKSAADLSGVSWMMTLTPAITILSSFISLVLVFHFSQRTESPVVKERTDTREISAQDENMCLTRVVFRLQDGQTHQ
ncbi:uncharacterized protein [Labrus bergylta]|uniref:uncharacterized protein n=1 Tax=Labrus bergylta TaxID=56723 RepID=UPI003313A8FA